MGGSEGGVGVGRLKMCGNDGLGIAPGIGFGVSDLVLYLLTLAASI